MKLVRNKKTSENQEIDLFKTADEISHEEKESDAAHDKNQSEIGNAQKVIPPSSKPSRFTRTSAWKILVVDDEPEIHAITKLSLSDLRFDEKKLQFFSAMSGEEAKAVLAQEPDIAVALIDIVMETEDAGLRLVEYIRNELHNRQIRLIIRTGQPGTAPERYVIDHYDIDDYKDKTELTAQRLYTTLRTTLKAYRDLITIDNNRQGLEKILDAAPNLYRIQPMEIFLEGVLTQITSLCAVEESCIVAKLHPSSTQQQESQTNKTDIIIQVGTGKYQNQNASSPNYFQENCRFILNNKTPPDSLPAHSLLLPLQLDEQALGFIYLEDVGFLSEENHYLLQVMATQCAAALKNLTLYLNLEEANRQNELKNQMLSMAAHDLRNPLGIIQNFSILLQQDFTHSQSLSEKQQKWFQVIQNTSQFTLSLVNNLLDVTKIEAGQLKLELQTTDLLTLVNQAIDLNLPLADSKQIQLNFHYKDPLPSMTLDVVKIQQVLNNLLSNAIKYSHSQSQIDVQITQEEHQLILAVKDQGQGIPTTELEKLFQPFSKTSVKTTGGETSTGLGLLICRKIVEGHQGQIWVESQEGKGSTFYVALPRG
jgi:signal transduction histidine kinase/CheY-like chemotaxis protein